jgi:hypothetical protein
MTLPGGIADDFPTFSSPLTFRQLPDSPDWLSRVDILQFPTMDDLQFSQTPDPPPIGGFRLELPVPLLPQHPPPTPCAAPQTPAIFRPFESFAATELTVRELQRTIDCRIWRPTAFPFPDLPTPQSGNAKSAPTF